MFYSTQILAKKGPLGTIWIASHLDRRLKRHQVFETNISITVDSIINPEAPLALRLSGQLLLGVVKVHQKKVGYLYEDCNDALVKIKLAFKPNDVDLPTAGTVAPHNAITLPDNYNDIDFLEESFSAEPFIATGSDRPAPLQLGKRESFLLADDISLLLGSQTSLDGEERFEVSGDEMERHMSLSLDEPEVLRREMSAADAGTPGYMGDDTPGSYDADERLEAPPEGMFDLAAMQDPGQPDFGDQPPTPEQMGDELADLDVLPVPDDIMADLDQLGGAEVPAPAAQRAAGGGQREKKRRAQLDINANAQPATQLDGAAIRALLVNRAPLLRPRRALAEQPLGNAPDLLHVARYNDEAAESALLRPSFSAAMARPLYEVYARRLAVTGAAEREAPSRRRRQAGADTHAEPHADAEEPANAREAAMPEEGPHAAVQTPAVEGAPAEFDEPPLGDEPMHFEDQFDAPMDVEGMPDPEDLQHAASQSRSSRRLTMNGEQGFSNSPSTTVKSLDSLGELEGDPDEPDIDKTSFTARTKKVASHLKAELLGAAGKKKRRLASGAAASSKGHVMLDDLVEGHRRVDACRWFFELLVLKTKNYVDLEQPQPYGNISITARPKLLAM